MESMDNHVSAGEPMESQSATDDPQDESQRSENLRDTSSKIQSHQDSAYGSLECSSQGQSQKSYNGSGSGSASGGGRAKSQNSQSSFSTGQSRFSTNHSNAKSLLSSSSRSSGFDHEFSPHMCKAPRSKDVKHKEHKKKKTKDKQEKSLSIKEEVLEPARSVTVAPQTEDEKGGIVKPTDPTTGPSVVYTQALNYIRKVKKRSDEMGVPFASPKLDTPTPSKPVEKPLLKDASSGEGFSVAISMVDGSVLEVTPGVTKVIGYPKDMLLGQSFIDFVYPKDSINFYSKIIHGLKMPYGKESLKDSEYGSPFYCRLRVFHSLEIFGFGIRNKKMEYKPCLINLKIMDDEKKEATPLMYGSQSAILVEITPIVKAYTTPDEIISGAENFTIRHSASCNFSEYSAEAIPFLGHLPQDLTGNSIFDCYHPEDLARMKRIYTKIVMEQGKPYRSPPFRFRTYNNSWVTLETEWLCFVNPWTKKIDSIIGQHHVVKGPKDINIFGDPAERIKTPIPDDLFKENQKTQSDILDLLAQPVSSYRDPCREPMEKRRRNLVDLMAPFVDQLDNMERKMGVLPFCEEFRTILSGRRKMAQKASELAATGSSRNAGNMSPPPQEDRCCESTTRSSNTTSPVSYSNLNFSHTIERFFKSHPKTVISSDESGDSKIRGSSQQAESTDEGKSCSQFPQSASNSNGKYPSISQSGSGYGDNVYNSNSNGNMSGESGGSGENVQMKSSSKGSYTPVALTEEILSKHNQDQQCKFMESQRKITKHRTHKGKHRKNVKRKQGLKRSANFCDQDANAKKHLYMTSSACSAASYKRSSSKKNATNNRQATLNDNRSTRRTREYQEVIHSHPQPDRQIRYANAIPIPNLVDSSGHSNNKTFQSSIPPFYKTSPNEEPNNGPSTSSDNNNIQSRITQSNNNCPSHVPLHPRGYNPMPSFVVPPQNPIIPSQGMTLSFPYMSTFPGVFYQPVAPPIFNAPPVMLPNMVFQHTVVQHPHSSRHMSSDERLSGLDSDQDFIPTNVNINKKFQVRKSPALSARRPDSQATSVKADVGSVKGSKTSLCGRHISHSILPECCPSYVDSRPCTFNAPSTSILVEAESVGSPEKEEKSQGCGITATYTSSDMIMSLSGSNGSPGEKSSDDSANNASDSNSSTPHWNKSRMNQPRPVLSEPPWLDNVQITPQLLYRYQLKTQELVEVLRRDMEVLKKTKQPILVDDQLGNLYDELENEGESPDLHLSEGLTSSSSSGEEQRYTSTAERAKSKKHSSLYYSKMAMIHEEDAPLPPSDSDFSS